MTFPLGMAHFEETWFVVLWSFGCHFETTLQRCCCISNGPQSPMALPVDCSKSLPFRSDSPISNT